MTLFPVLLCSTCLTCLQARAQSTQQNDGIAVDVTKQSRLLIEQLGHQDHQFNARTELENLSESAVPELRKALRHNNGMISWNSAVVLTRLGPKAKSAIPDLDKIVQDGSDRILAMQAIKAIKAIDPSRVNDKKLVLREVPRIDLEGRASKPAVGPTEFDAILMVRFAVRRRLVAPATATFGGEHTSPDAQGDPLLWGVRGHVDSQNRFGAMVRTEFVATAKYLGGDRADDRNWKIDVLLFANWNMPRS